MNDQTEKVYVCTGSCGAVISEERYKNGLTKCGAKECNLFQKPFEEKLKCKICGKIFKKEEEHIH